VFSFVERHCLRGSFLWMLVSRYETWKNVRLLRERGIDTGGIYSGFGGPWVFLDIVMRSSDWAQNI
jgi:hypothetical protein